MRGDQLLELSPYFVLAILFVVPFVDPRRPFRLLHLDVLVLSGFGLYSIALLDRGPLFASVRWSTVIAAAGLIYVLARSGYALLRDTGGDPSVYFVFDKADRPSAGPKFHRSRESPGSKGFVEPRARKAGSGKCFRKSN